MKRKVFILVLAIFSLISLKGIAQYSTEITVAQDGSGDYTSIQSAIDACKAYPDVRITVYIKNGTYNEKVYVPECNTKLTLIGESVDETIIVYNDYFKKINRGRNSTFYTYTLKVDADSFRAENLTIVNNAGKVGQAVALHINGDRCSLKNCRILGNQDTLYTEGNYNRSYFNNCYIEGTVDFIFGAATALFDSCVIHNLSNSYITAASTAKGKKFGYVFSHCKLTAEDSLTNVSLGRPWRDYAKVVFMHCDLGEHIKSEGWSNWSRTNRDKTAYYAEYKNYGKGACINSRIPWSHQLTDCEAAEYTPKNILSPVVFEGVDAIDWIK